MLRRLTVDSNGSGRLAKQYKRPACDPNGSFCTVDIMSIALFFMNILYNFYLTINLNCLNG